MFQLSALAWQVIYLNKPCTQLPVEWADSGSLISEEKREEGFSPSTFEYKIEFMTPFRSPKSPFDKLWRHCECA